MFERMCHLVSDAGFATFRKLLGQSAQRAGSRRLARRPERVSRHGRQHLNYSVAIPALIFHSVHGSIPLCIRSVCKIPRFTRHA